MSEGPAEGKCPHIKAKTPLTRGYACPRWDSNRTPALANTGKSRKHAEFDPVRHQYDLIQSRECAHCAHPLFVYFGDPNRAARRPHRQGGIPVEHDAQGSGNGPAPAKHRSTVRPFCWKPTNIPAHEMGWPTNDDFWYHLTTLFPPIPPRGWMELRVLDALPRTARSAAAWAVAIIGQSGVREEIHERLPDTNGPLAGRSPARSTPPRARPGRTDPSVLSSYAEHVADSRQHVDLLQSFLDEFTAHHHSPGSRTSIQLPIDLTGPSPRPEPLRRPDFVPGVEPNLACMQ
jgi:hypothetical protein